MKICYTVHYTPSANLKKETMRVGIVGAGSMGSTHCAGWKFVETSGARLAGIMSRTRSSAAALAEQYGCAVYDQYDDLLTDVDIVYTRNSTFFRCRDA